MMQLGRNFAQKFGLALELYCHAHFPCCIKIQKHKRQKAFFLQRNSKILDFKQKYDDAIGKKFVRKLGLASELYHHHNFL